MSNPLKGWSPISRGELHNLVLEGMRWEHEFRDKKRNACYEFYDRTEHVSDNRTKVKILREVAAKYGFREEWFMEQVKF